MSQINISFFPLNKIDLVIKVRALNNVDTQAHKFQYLHNSKSKSNDRNMVI